MSCLDVRKLQLHQLRVIEEQLELDERIEKLSKFLHGPAAALQVDKAELVRLNRQLIVMNSYSAILAERISAFG